MEPEASLVLDGNKEVNAVGSGRGGKLWNAQAAPESAREDACGAQPLQGQSARLVVDDGRRAARQERALARSARARPSASARASLTTTSAPKGNSANLSDTMRAGRVPFPARGRRRGSAAR